MSEQPAAEEARAYKVGDLVYVYEQPEMTACPTCHRDYDEPQKLYVVTPAKTEGDA